MDQMFYQAAAFNSDLSAWTVAPDALTTGMFSDATGFDPSNVAEWTAWVRNTTFAPAN